MATLSVLLVAAAAVASAETTEVPTLGNYFYNDGLATNDDDKKCDELTNAEKDEQFSSAVQQVQIVGESDHETAVYRMKTSDVAEMICDCKDMCNNNGSDLLSSEHMQFKYWTLMANRKTTRKSKCFCISNANKIVDKRNGRKVYYSGVVDWVTDAESVTDLPRLEGRRGRMIHQDGASEESAEWLSRRKHIGKKKQRWMAGWHKYENTYTPTETLSHMWDQSD